MDFSLQPTLAGSALAALSIAGGAPWFSDGLRALRLRRHLPRLQETPLAQAPSALAQVHGQVALEGPLFAPLSGKPCAGFRLEVFAAEAARPTLIDVRRPFRLRQGSDTARVFAERGIWELGVTGERQLESREPLGTQLETLLEGSPEARWARGIGRAVRLVERALLAGSECHVIGQVRRGHPYEQPAELEWGRTGTDDRVALDGRSHGRHEPEYWVDAGGLLEFAWVSDRAPEPADLRWSPLRLIGLVCGPVLGLGGLLYLANAADQLRALGPR